MGDCRAGQTCSMEPVPAFQRYTAPASATATCAEAAHWPSQPHGRISSATLIGSAAQDRQVHPSGRCQQQVKNKQSAGDASHRVVAAPVQQVEVVVVLQVRCIEDPLWRLGNWTVHLLCRARRGVLRVQ